MIATSNKLNIFVYYFAKFGMSESLEFLDMKCEFNEKESDEDDVINVKINNNLSSFQSAAFWQDDRLCL